MNRILLALCAASLFAAQPLRAGKPADADTSKKTLPWTQPEFPDGGLVGLRRWVLRQLTLPAWEFDPGDFAMVRVSAEITRKGKLREVKTIRTSHDAVARQVVKLLGRSPEWTPPMRGDKPADGHIELLFEMQFQNAAAPDGTPDLRAEDVSIYTRADTLPGFGGGNFTEWIRKRILAANPDADGELRRLKVTLVVEKDGSVSNIKLGGEKDDPLRRQVGTALREMPAWSPAVMQGEPIRFRISATVPFGPEKLREAEPQEELCQTADVMPSFEGGDLDTFRKWVQTHVKYPTEALRDKASGRVIVSFIVEKDGAVSHIEILHSPHSALSSEVERALGNSPAWTPGRQKGKTVRVKYTIPVNFRIPTPADPNSRSKSRVVRF